jgi:23S rRNA (cytidine1920-2'-O)/16S rRNA (cytidine1409-2'-O)-methyltransferase
MRERLDALLVGRGLFASRAQARAAVLAGEVSVDGRVVDKPGTQVGETVVTDVVARRRYVSRGGDKLDTALTRLGVDVSGEDVLDLGSSTGGVGYGQLDWRLREDPRVTVLERTNARQLTAQRLPFAPSFVTADLSFISLTVALAPVLECLREGFRGLVLVKPQFEAGRERVGKGGVVRDPVVHADVLHSVAAWLQKKDAVVDGVCDSGHPGPKGNVEYFILFSDAHTAGPAPGPASELVRRAVEAVHG